MKDVQTKAVLLVFSVLLLAGCASMTTGESPPVSKKQEENVWYEGSGWSWGWGGGINSGGPTGSTTGWRVRDGKLQHEIREYDGRGGRRR